MMSLKSRRELLLAILERYETSGKAEKGAILGEFASAAGYNRKYAIHLINAADAKLAWPKSGHSVPRQRPRKYGPDVEVLLLTLWRVSGGLCAKRLMPFLSELLEAPERSEEINPCPRARQKLLEMSAATADRILSRLRRSDERGLCTTRTGELLRHQIPIRTYEDWADARPGFFEIDLVAHCGNTVAGEFVHTLTMTDISTGWTECAALLNRSQLVVAAGIEMIRKRLPFALLGIDSDNGSEFINHHLKRYCDEKKITFTRCRPYKKNDQCHVEQKNGAVVRPLVGYSRYEGEEAVRHLNALYGIHRLCVNFFEPSMKLIGKTRTGARVKKIYDEAKTPWQRLTIARTLGAEKQKLIKERYLRLNPAELRRELDALELGLRPFAMNNPVPSPGATQNKKAQTEGSNESKA